MRSYNASYWKIPFGEIRYGHITKSVTVWFRKRKYVIWPGNTDMKFGRNK